DHGREADDPRLLRRPRRPGVRPPPPAAQAAAVPRRPARPGPARRRPRAPRPERPRRGGDHVDRLVRAVLGRKARRRVAVEGRELATVQNGDSGEFAHYVRSPGGAWKPFAGFRDAAVQAVFGPGGDLFVVSRKDAPTGKVLRLSAADPDLGKAAVVIPAGGDAI